MTRWFTQPLRLVGALLAMLGLVLTLLGLWFVSHLGTSGTATLRAEPGSSLVVLPPSVVNRTDGDVRITATAADDAEVWIGTARPSDAEAIIGDARRVLVTGASARSWSLTTQSVGGGGEVPLSSIDAWGSSTTGEGSAEVTVRQSQAPQTVAISTSRPATITTVTYEVTEGSWATKAIATTVGGLLALGAGIALIFLARRRSAGTARHRSTRTPLTEETR